MQRSLFVLAVFVAFPVLSSAQRATCAWDDGNGPLCQGLVSYYKFEEGSDSLRKDSYGYSDLRECPGTNVGSASGKLGTNAVNFTGAATQGLTLPFGGQFGRGFWTIAAWVYPTDNSASRGILSTHSSLVTKSMGTGVNTGPSGVKLYLWKSGASLYPRVEVYENETDTQKFRFVNTNVTLNTWHLIVVKSSPTTVGHAEICISLDGAAFLCTAYNFNIRGNLGWLVVGKDDASCAASLPIGQYFFGRIDSLAIYSRAWSPNDLALFWNSGTGRDFPF
jgi:hypothetical protein